MAHGNEIENTAAAVDGVVEADAGGQEQSIEHFATWSLDMLHTAKASGDAATRRAVTRVLAFRQAIASASSEDRRDVAPEYRVSVGKSRFGTPVPTVTIRGEGGARVMSAAAHELCADVERALASTPEQWTVAMMAGGTFADVTLGLLLGTAVETKRAVAVLESITGRRARTRRARSDDGAEAAGGESSGESSGEPGASNGSAASSSGSSGSSTGATGDDPHGGRIRRRRRQQFRELAGKDATAFEARMLSRDRSTLPDFVQPVVEGGEKTESYWTWLADEFRAQKIDGGAK